MRSLTLVVGAILVVLTTCTGVSFATMTIDSYRSGLSITGDSDDDDLDVAIGEKDSDDHFIVEISSDSSDIELGSGIDDDIAICTEESTYVSCEVQRVSYYNLYVIDHAGTNSLNVTGDSALSDEFSSYDLALQSADIDKIRVDLPTSCSSKVKIDLTDDTDQDEKDNAYVDGGCNSLLSLTFKDGAYDSYMIKDPGVARGSISISKDKFPTDIGLIWNRSLFASGWPGPVGP